MGLQQSMPAADGGEGPPPPPQPSYWQMIKMGYNELVGAIIRPPRAEYLTTHLGPPSFEFCGRAFQRRDFEVVNERGQRLQCSHWEPVEYPVEEEDDQQQQRNPKEQRTGSLPCIVYMHGNSSARIEALPQLSLCLSLGITLVALDFAGSGRSEGEFVSLGYYEKDDLKAVIEHLRASGRVSRIALWGRSMGAVTALMHGERDPSLAAMVRYVFFFCDRVLEALSVLPVSFRACLHILFSCSPYVQRIVIETVKCHLPSLPSPLFLPPSRSSTPPSQTLPFSPTKWWTRATNTCRFNSLPY